MRNYHAPAMVSVSDAEGVNVSRLSEAHVSIRVGTRGVADTTVNLASIVLDVTCAADLRDKLTAALEDAPGTTEPQQAPSGDAA